jgi:integrase
MYVKQNLSILFYRKRKKATTDGKAPIYVRVTIDGLDDEISLGIKVSEAHWDNENKTVSTGEPKCKEFNKIITCAKTDLQRHFDLVQAKYEIATPELVFQSYKTPLNGEKIREEKVKNLELSESIDETTDAYLRYYSKYLKATEHGRVPAPAKQILLKREKQEIDEKIEKLAKEGAKIFDNKNWVKTVVLAIDEHLLNFMQLASVGERSPNTLEKMWGRKKRYLEFLEYRYKTIDLPLDKLEYRFMDQLTTYCMVQKQVIENTAMKYAQALKEIIERSAANGWISTSPFSQFKCTYVEPHHDWLTMHELEDLRTTQFANPKLNLIKDIYVFCSYTGLAYQEVYSLSPSDIITGIDGKQWINKERQKTDGDETLPLLPLPLTLIEKYKNHPVSTRRNKIFPVPSNVEFNRCLKVIASLKDFKIILRTHKGRFYFANEICYANGVPLKTTGRMLGQKSIKTTEKYVRANRQAISESMENVEARLFNRDGSLKSRNGLTANKGKLIEMKIV